MPKDPQMLTGVKKRFYLKASDDTLSASKVKAAASTKSEKIRCGLTASFALPELDCSNLSCFFMEIV